MRRAMIFLMGCLAACHDDRDQDAVRVRIWVDAVPLQGSIPEVHGVAVAAGSEGSAVAVWVASEDGSEGELRASFFRRSSGWSPISVIESFPGLALSPLVAMNEHGEAVVVWLQQGFQRYVVYSSTSHDGGWCEPIAIDWAQGGEPWDLTMTSDRAGNAVAVWVQEDAGAVRRVYANRLCGYLGWTGAQRIDPTMVQEGNNQLNLGGAVPINYGNSDSPRVATTEDGRIAAVWLQAVDGQKRVFATDYYPPGPGVIGGWNGSPQAIDAGADFVFNPEVAFDPAGNVLAVWAEGPNLPGRTIFGARCVDYEWQPAETISDPAEIATYPKIAAGTVAWTQGPAVYARRTAGGHWGAAFPVDTQALALRVQLAADDSGDVWAVWESDGAHVRVARIGEEPRNLEVNTESIYDIVIAAGCGEAYVLWSQGEQVWARRTEHVEPSAPKMPSRGAP